MKKPTVLRSLCYIAVFFIGIVTPFGVGLLTAPLSRFVLASAHLIINLFQQWFFASGSLALDILLKYSIFPFAFLFAPSVNALLFRFDSTPGKAKFLTFILQMLIYYSLLYPSGGCIPLCIGNDCLLLKGETAVLSSVEQIYIVLGLNTLALGEMLIGSYIACYNPIRLLIKGIRHLFEQRKNQALAAKSQDPPKEYVISLYPVLASFAWAPLLFIILVSGLLFLPFKSYKWALDDNKPKILKVYVETHPTRTELYKAQYLTYTKEALANWTNVSQGHFKFQLVSNKNDCQICIDWIPFDANNLLDLMHLGLTTIEPEQANFEYISKAHITVKSQNMPANAIRKVLTHEIGHALGLGHTESPNDVMYENVAVTKEERKKLLSSDVYLPRLSIRDIKALLEKYPQIRSHTLQK